jgi:hypothetical protein
VAPPHTHIRTHGRHCAHTPHLLVLANDGHRGDAGGVVQQVIGQRVRARGGEVAGGAMGERGQRHRGAHHRVQASGVEGSGEVVAELPRVGHRGPETVGRPPARADCKRRGALLRGCRSQTKPTHACTPRMQTRTPMLAGGASGGSGGRGGARERVRGREVRDCAGGGGGCERSGRLPKERRAASTCGSGARPVVRTQQRCTVIPTAP